MCSIKDAQREEKLASLFSQENNHSEAIQHYLEACSIYLLNHELEKKPKWLKNAQQCYQEVQKLRGEVPTELNKQELAQRSLQESQPTKETTNYLQEIKRTLNKPINSTICAEQKSSKMILNILSKSSKPGA